MDLLDSHLAIVGASGGGKTVTAKGYVEILLDAGRHVCIIDPTGAWSGLRSNAAGDGPGFPIPIFGGQQGDVEIYFDQGEDIGRIVADGVSAIIDISDLRTGREQRHFTRDLLRALRAKPNGQFHLIVDEADEFASQKPRDDFGFQVAEELIWMAKRGRLAGFVLMLITQRPASIDKEVLTQAQTVIVHQLVAPVDQKPIIDYLRDNAGKAELTTIKGSLATLAKGERWVYSPRQGLLERGMSPMPRTFDSSRTPGPGESLTAPKMLAQIDLGEIRAKLSPEGKHEVSVCDFAQVSDLSDVIAEKDRQISDLIKRNAALYTELRATSAALERLMDVTSKMRTILNEAPAEGGGGPEGDDEQTQRQRHEPQGVTPGEATLNTAGQKMLDMLDHIAPAKVTWAILAAMCGYKPSGGNFNTARKAMRASGRVIEDGDLIRSAAEPAGGMTREQAKTLWKGVLSNPAPQFIDALQVRPMSREQLGEFTNRAARGGSFNTGVAQLLRNGVAIDRGGVLHLAQPLPGEA